jgi:hypothetical protein
VAARPTVFEEAVVEELNFPPAFGVNSNSQLNGAIRYDFGF